MASVQTEQPLTSVAAFALALVEASSHLTEAVGMSDLGDAGALPVPRNDDTVVSAE